MSKHLVPAIVYVHDIRVELAATPATGWYVVKSTIGDTSVALTEKQRDEAIRLAALTYTHNDR